MATKLLVALAILLTTARGAAAAEPVVAARVNDAPLYAGQVERQLRLAYGDRKIEPSVLPRLRARALEQLIDQRAVLEFLARHGQAASSQDVDLAIAHLEKSLDRQQSNVAAYLEESDMSREELRHTLLWRITWHQYLQRHLTDENLQRYFNDHRKQFDGARLKVAHILWKLPEGASADTISQLAATAQVVRDDIVTGKMSFADAAAQHSQAPTAEHGGDIGFIGRHDTMPESFSAAAFSLAKGEVSKPVTTRFGVHLITVLQEEPGTGTWREARPRLVEAVRQYLFEWAASRGRPQLKVEYTDAWPHFRPGTKELATP